MSNRREIAWVAGLAMVLILIVCLIAAPAPSNPVLQQFVFTGIVGDEPHRVAAFLPAKPIALGLQVTSGSRILTVGDLLNCRPFDDMQKAFLKTADGEMEELHIYVERLNCGAPRPGDPDRILTLQAIVWPR